MNRVLPTEPPSKAHQGMGASACSEVAADTCTVSHTYVHTCTLCNSFHTSRGTWYNPTLSHAYICSFMPARVRSQFPQLLGCLGPPLLLPTQTTDQLLRSIKFLLAEVQVCFQLSLFRCHSLKLIIQGLQLVQDLQQTCTPYSCITHGVTTDTTHTELHSGQ